MAPRETAGVIAWRNGAVLIGAGPAPLDPGGGRSSTEKAEPGVGRPGRRVSIADELIRSHDQAMLGRNGELSEADERRRPWSWPHAYTYRVDRPLGKPWVRDELWRVTWIEGRIVLAGVGLDEHPGLGIERLEFMIERCCAERLERHHRDDRHHVTEAGPGNADTR